MAVQRRLIGGFSEDDTPQLDPSSYDQPEAPQAGPGVPTDGSGNSTQAPPPPPMVSRPAPNPGRPNTGPDTPPPPATPPSTPTTPPTPATTPPPPPSGDFLSRPGIANGGGWGGGWDQSWATPLDHALQAEIANGLSGQAAIDAIRKDYPSVDPSAIEYYPATGMYGMPGNQYIAPNKANNNALDLILRPGVEGGGGNTTSTDPTLPDATFNTQFQPIGNTSNDPMSFLTDNKLQELIQNNGKVADTNGQIEALNLEQARGQADRARNAEMSGLDAALANRGLLDQYDPAGGQHAASANYVERNDISPMFSGAVQNYMINDNNLASQRLMGALSDVTNRQGVISNIALQSLAQNTAFDEFAATYGLQKDQILEQLKSGNDTNLINLLNLFLQQNGQLNQGFH